MPRYQIAARVDEDEKDAIDIYCDMHDISISQLIRWAVREYIENHQD